MEVLETLASVLMILHSFFFLSKSWAHFRRMRQNPLHDMLSSALFSNYSYSAYFLYLRSCIILLCSL